jgi:hypothetical protein
MSGRLLVRAELFTKYEEEKMYESFCCIGLSTGLCRHRRNVGDGRRARTLSADVEKATSKRRRTLQGRLHRRRLHQNETVRSLPEKSRFSIDHFEGP